MNYRCPFWPHTEAVWPPKAALPMQHRSLVRVSQVSSLGLLSFHINDWFFGYGCFLQISVCASSAIAMRPSPKTKNAPKQQAPNKLKNNLITHRFIRQPQQYLASSSYMYYC